MLLHSICEVNDRLADIAFWFSAEPQQIADFALVCRVGFGEEIASVPLSRCAEFIARPRKKNSASFILSRCQNPSTSGSRVL